MCAHHGKNCSLIMRSSRLCSGSNSNGRDMLLSSVILTDFISLVITSYSIHYTKLYDMVATPAGSTAYNLSAHGPILPLESKLLALTPISPFRPRRWTGAILPHTSEIEFIINNESKRPVSAVADHTEVRDIKSRNNFV